MKQLVSLIATVALAAIATACATIGSNPHTLPGDSPEVAVMGFLTAVLHGNIDGAVALANYPMMLDSKCRYITKEAPLREALAKSMRAETKTTFTVSLEGRLVPGKPLPSKLKASWRESVQWSLDKFLKTSGCDEATDALMVQAAQGEVAFVLAIIKADGRGDTPTVMRARKTAKGWRVTGLDN